MDQIQDQFFLKETLKLAKKGRGWTNPNPMVGAVIVKNNQIIGKGYHKKAGLPHAEIEALNDAKTSVRGATLYLNLEPCSHYGKTPPCALSIIKSGISQVICSTIDPNPQINGQGVEWLRKAGIKVSVGLLEQEARILNEAFFIFHEKKRPFVAIKFAASLDGKMATHTGDSKWITNEKARTFARNLRGEYQAILLGINTVIHDNPHLGARSIGKKDPLRIILDSNLRIPVNSQVLRDNNVLIATTIHAPKDKKKLLEKQGIPILTFESEDIPLKELLFSLKSKNIISVLVEGGGKILGSFIDEKLIDKVYAFYAPILIGGREAEIKNALYLKRISSKYFQDNFLVVGKV